MQRAELSTGEIPEWSNGTFVCSGKRRGSGGVEEWGDRKY